MIFGTFHVPKPTLIAKIGSPTYRRGVASGFPALRESNSFLIHITNYWFCPSSDVRRSTTTQLTSHVHKFPLTHEISLGHLSFFSKHPNRDFSRYFPQTHRWGRISLFLIRLPFVTRILQSTSHDRGLTRSLLFRGWILTN